MSTPPVHPIAASVKARDQELAREFRKIEKRDRWVWAFSIFVVFVLAFAVMALSFPAVRRGEETFFKISMPAVFFGLIALPRVLRPFVLFQGTLLKSLALRLS